MSTTEAQARKHFNQRRAIEVALDNELATRERVKKLEAEVKTLGTIATNHRIELSDVQNVMWRSLYGRLKWLVTGK